VIVKKLCEIGELVADEDGVGDAGLELGARKVVSYCTPARSCGISERARCNRHGVSHQKKT